MHPSNDVPMVRCQFFSFFLVLKPKVGLLSHCNGSEDLVACIETTAKVFFVQGLEETARLPSAFLLLVLLLPVPFPS